MLEQALVLCRERGYPDATGRVLNNLAFALLCQRRNDEAAEQLHESLVLFQATGATNGVIDAPRRARDVDECVYDETLAAVRAELGEARAASSLSRGSDLSREEAITEALHGSD